MRIEQLASQNIDFSKIRTMLNEGKQPHVKLGIDPTSPDLHLGHLVPLRMLYGLLSEGCRATLVIGDLTAQIGDPAGQDKSRPVISQETTKSNAEKIMKQIKSILPGDGWEFVLNSSITPTMEELFSLMQHVTINSMLSRDHFSARHKNGDSISLLEMTCPILQAWDSIKLRCDLEIGGNDQLTNCVLARDLMEKVGLDKQSILLFPLLTGTDGKKKMSKSTKNHISLTDHPNDMFGKIMSIPDDLITEWWKLLMGNEPLWGDPLKDKELLAASLTSDIHDGPSSCSAQEWFDDTFRKKNVKPEAAINVKSGSSIIDVLVQSKLASSRSNARRLIQGGGVKINTETVSDIDKCIADDCILQKGKRTAINISIC